jgi:hypothetical protein
MAEILQQLFVRIVDGNVRLEAYMFNKLHRVRRVTLRTAKMIQRLLYRFNPYSHRVQHSTILRSAHTVYLCVFCGTENKQRLFPYTALTDWFLLPRRSLFTARYGLGLYI